MLCCQHPTPSRQNRGEEGSVQPQNKMPSRVLTADKHAGSFPTGSGGLKCILPEKREDRRGFSKTKQVMRGWADGTVKRGTGDDTRVLTQSAEKNMFPMRAKAQLCLCGSLTPLQNFTRPLVWGLKAACSVAQRVPSSGEDILGFGMLWRVRFL